MDWSPGHLQLPCEAIWWTKVLLVRLLSVIWNHWFLSFSKMEVVTVQYYIMQVYCARSDHYRKWPSVPTQSYHNIVDHIYAAYYIPLTSLFSNRLVPLNSLPVSPTSHPSPVNHLFICESVFFFYYYWLIFCFNFYWHILDINIVLDSGI